MALDSSFRSPQLLTPNPVIKPATMNPSPELRSRSEVPAGASAELMNWITQALKEGQAMLSNESEGEDVDENIKMTMGQYKDLSFEANKPSYRSSHFDTRIGKNINDVASAITDFKPTWHYMTENKQYEHQGQILDKLTRAWWYNNHIDLKLQLLVKQSLVARTGYAHLVWNPTLWNGVGDCDIVIKDYRDVIPIRPNSRISIQDAFGVIIRSRNTVNWAKARYGDAASTIVPTTEGSFIQNSANKFKVSSPALDYLESQRRKVKEFAIPLYDHYEIYVKDTSINAGNEPVWIGPQPADKHPWGYWVDPGKPLYPRGRLIICANLTHILFDGGNPYWHGMFPVSKLTLDPMPWSFLGKSAIADAKSAQLLSIELLQGITDAARKTLRPGIIADKNAVPREVLNRFDSREPGFKLKTNPSVGQGISLEVVQPLPPFIMELRAELQQSIDYVMGVLDMRALEQVRDLNNANASEETMLEYLGPSVRTRGRVLEVFLRELGDMMKSNIFQFYTMQRRVQVIGNQALDFEDFDYDPGSLVPAGEGTRGQRAEAHAKCFTFWIAPNSLLNLSKSQEQLKYMMLFKMGVIDPVTLLEKLEVSNIGEIPGNPITVIDRMQAASQMGFTGAVSPQGRPASFQQQPQMRGDGSISTSG